MSTAVRVCVQVRLLHDGRERGRMYSCYALSSILSTKSGMTEIRAAGVIPALIHVLTSSKVTPDPGCVRALCLAGHGLSCPFVAYPGHL